MPGCGNVERNGDWMVRFVAVNTGVSTELPSLFFRPVLVPSSSEPPRWLSLDLFNPFTARDCKSSGLNDARTRLQTVCCLVGFSAVSFDVDLFIFYCKTTTTRQKGLRV